MVRFVGARPVPMPLREERRFRFDPDEFRSLVSNRTRLIIVNSPHNPTGSVLTRADLEVIADVARDHDIVVLSDEIYSRLLYSGQQAAIAALDGPQEAVDRMLAEFTARRSAIVSGLNALPGVRCLEPDGAFYAFPNITGTGASSSRELADRLLEEAGVACLAGT